MSLSQSQRDWQRAGQNSNCTGNLTLPCTHLGASPDYKSGTLIDFELFLGAYRAGSRLDQMLTRGELQHTVIWLFPCEHRQANEQFR